MAGKYSNAILGGPAAPRQTPQKYGAAILGQRAPQTPMAAPQRPRTPSPLDPSIVERGMILPYGITKDDELEFALPQFAADITEDIMLPGRVLKGEAYTPEEVTRLGLTAAMPALRGIGGTAARQIPQKAITRAQVKEAPTARELGKRGGALFERAKGSDAIISPDSYHGVLTKMETDLFESGFDPGLHPKAAASLNALGKRLGSEMDMQDIQTARRLAQNAASSLDPDEARLGGRMVGHIDDWVDTLGDKDLIEGSVAGAADTLRQARTLWGKMRKTEMIDDIFARAERQPSGIENGLRIGFRALLNDKKRMRGFSADEKAAMEEVVRGTFTRNTLKRLGKLGPGAGQQTNVLGAMGGAGGGALLGGPVGMVGVPAAGYGAQKLGERGTRLAAEKARAMAAGVRPGAKMAYPGTQGVPRFALGQALGAGVPQGRLAEDLQRGAPTGGMTPEQIRRLLAQGGT